MRKLLLALALIVTAVDLGGADSPEWPPDPQWQRVTGNMDSITTQQALGICNPGGWKCIPPLPPEGSYEVPDFLYQWEGSATCDSVLTPDPMKWDLPQFSKLRWWLNSSTGDTWIEWVDSVGTQGHVYPAHGTPFMSFPDTAYVLGTQAEHYNGSMPEAGCNGYVTSTSDPKIWFYIYVLEGVEPPHMHWAYQHPLTYWTRPWDGAVTSLPALSGPFDVTFNPWYEPQDPGIGFSTVDGRRWKAWFYEGVITGNTATVDSILSPIRKMHENPGVAPNPLIYLGRLGPGYLHQDGRLRVHGVDYQTAAPEYGPPEQNTLYYAAMWPLTMRYETRATVGIQPDSTYSCAQLPITWRCQWYFIHAGSSHWFRSGPHIITSGKPPGNREVIAPEGPCGFDGVR